MQDGTNGDPPGSVFDASAALGELVTSLLDVPRTYDLFIRLSPHEQVRLVWWIDDAATARNRTRRVQMIRAVLARSDTETVTLQDTIWLDHQGSVDPGRP